MQQKIEISEKIALTVQETADLLSVSVPTVYKLVKRGDFPALKIGGRTLVSRGRLIDWVNTQSVQLEDMGQNGRTAV